MRAPAIADLVLALLVAGLVLLLGCPTPGLAHAGQQHAHTPAAPLAHTSAGATPAAAIFAAVIRPAAAPATPALSPLAARPVAPAPQLAPPGQGQVPRGGDTAAKAQQAPIAPLQQEGCCCGSLACHAGVMAAFVTIVNPYRLGERLRPRPVIATTAAALDGIERPPRVPLEA